MRLVSKTILRIVLAIIVTVAELAWFLLSVWGVVDGVAQKLRASGEIGTFVAALIVSPVVHITLIITAIVLFVLVLKELRKQKPPPPKQWYETPQNELTAGRLKMNDDEVARIESWRRMLTVAERKFKSGKETAPFAEIFDRQPDYVSLHPLLSPPVVSALNEDKNNPAKSADALKALLANEIARIERDWKLAPALRESSKLAPERPTSPDVEIGRFTCSVRDEDSGIPVPGTTVRIRHDMTGREYKGTTNRRGQADLSAPHGSYTVMINAEGYRERICAAKVNDPYGNHMPVTLQMEKAAREATVRPHVEGVIEQLIDSSKSGNDLLKKAASNPTDAIRNEINQWEAQTIEYIESRVNKAEALFFSSNAKIEVYHIAAATTAHRNLLNHLNTRIVRLNELIAKLQDHLDRGMLF